MDTANFGVSGVDSGRRELGKGRKMRLLARFIVFVFVSSLACHCTQRNPATIYFRGLLK